LVTAPTSSTPLARDRGDAHETLQLDQIVDVNEITFVLSPRDHSTRETEQTWHLLNSPRASPDCPLRGLKMFELGHFMAVPFCTLLLADYSTEVPDSGDIQSSGCTTSAAFANLSTLVIETKKDALQPHCTGTRLVGWSSRMTSIGEPAYGDFGP
jgi:hypothetical protein